MAKKKDGFGRIGDLKIVINQNPKPAAKKAYYAIRLQMPDGEEVCALFTEKQVALAVERAKKNPEDVIEAGNIFQKIQDLID